MNIAKGFVLLLIAANIVVTFMINDCLTHMIYFYSYWGDLAAFFATLFQIKATKYPETYQAAAILCQEMSWCFNLMIFPLFWIFIFPWELAQTDTSTNLGKIWVLHYFTTHTWPIVSCAVNQYLTKDMTMLRSDWKIMFYAGIIYIFCNWLGLQVEGYAMYPIADWTDYPFTIFAYFMLGCTQTYVYVLFTDWINSRKSKQ